MAAARRALFLLAVVLGSLVAVHPVLGGVGESDGRPAVGRSGTGPLLDLSALAVGDAATSSMTVANTGTGAGVFLLGGSTTGSRTLARHLRLVVSSGDRPLYRGSLAGLDSVRLGVLAPGEARTYSLRVELASGSDRLQGLQAAADFSISAVGA